MEERNQYNGNQDDSERSGNMIRDMRRKLRMSREQMAYGICSVQKYARIESGKDLPTEAEFSGLVNRLGEPGLYYSDMYTKGNSERLALRALIREEAMLDHWEKVSEYLCSYSHQFSPSVPEEKQFLGFYETIYCYTTSSDMNGILLSEMCNDLLVLGRPDFHSDPDINFVPTQSEFLLMNAIAIGLSEQEGKAFYEKSRSLLLSLLLLNKKRFIPSACRITRIGLLLNLCIIETDNSDFYPAERHLELLFRNIAYSGGSYFFYRALNCRADLFEKTGRAIEASDIRHSMHSLFHINSEKSHNKVLVF